MYIYAHHIYGRFFFSGIDFLKKWAAAFLERHPDGNGAGALEASTVKSIEREHDSNEKSFVLQRLRLFMLVGHCIFCIRCLGGSRQVGRPFPDT